MKRLPRDKKALLDEAISLGLLGENPDLKEPRAKLIDCVYKSWKIGRNINHVSIVLVGTTGVGKSSTINHLLGTKGIIKFAKTSESQSGTRSTQEFIVYGSRSRYQVKEIPLGLVDTPGFGDTDGSSQDACNLLSIRKFFRTHPKLPGHYPNLIFLMLKATDNRIKGENSELGKSLRCVKELQLVDPKNSNVVAILTHACGIRKKDADKWSKELETKKSDVEKIIFDALKVTAPVVLLENMYNDCELPVCGDYTRLPNGVLQPRNLYKACVGVLKKNSDHLGLVALNSIFATSTEVFTECGHTIEAKNAGNCALDAEERTMFNILESGTRGGLKDPIGDTVLQYIKEMKLELREQEEVMKIASILRQLGAEDSFRSASLQSIEYFYGDEISSTGRNMLREKFGITTKPRKTAFESGRLIGQGYNILTDKSVATQVMKLDTTTKYGIVIPKCAKFEKVEQTRYFMDLFENDESYVQARLQNLNVSLDVKPKVLMMGCRAGYNKTDDSASSSSTSEFSFLFEQRMFELKIGNYEEHQNNDGMSFTMDFESHVRKLPSTYDKEDHSCRSLFERFFNRFGHFLVSSAYGGGSVEIKCSRESVGVGKTSLAKAKASLAAAFEQLDLSTAEFNVSGSSSDGVNAKALLNRCTHSWEGGDATLRAKETIADKEKLQKWKISLLVNPTMLASEMSLEPISTAVGCVDPAKDQATYDALKDLLGGEFKILAEREKAIAEEYREKMDETTRGGVLEKPDQSGIKCFPSSSVVNIQSENGVIKQKEMVNLEVGDKVMGWDEKRNQAIFTEVIMFGHRASDAVDVEYLKIALEDGNRITLSGNHLVMVGKHKKALMAQNVKLGEILFTVDGTRKISPKKVLAVDKVIEQGVYCPITLCGNLIVDNVLASCYASVQDHIFLKGLVKISAQSTAHFGLMPMRALHKLRLRWWRKIPNGQTIHPYLQWLCKLKKLPFMAN